MKWEMPSQIIWSGAGVLNMLLKEALQDYSCKYGIYKIYKNDTKVFNGYLCYIPQWLMSCEVIRWIRYDINVIIYVK